MAFRGSRTLDRCAAIAHTKYEAGNADLSLRAFLSQANEASTQKSAVLVDVRSPQEFTGEILAPPDCRTRASVEDTYQARAIFRGAKHATKMARLSPPMNSGASMGPNTLTVPSP